MDGPLNSLNPLLRIASIAGVEIAVKHHISRGDDINARDGKGATPLMLAAGRKKSGVVRLLLSAHANPALSDATGRDALAYAEKAGCDECAALIRGALADLTSALVESRGTQQAPLREPSSALIQEALLSGETISFSDPQDCRDEYVIETAHFADEGTTTPSERTSQEPGLVGEVVAEDNLPSLTGGVGSPVKLNEPSVTFELDDSGLELDIDDWEVEPDAVAPAGDDSVAQEAQALHKVIGQHRAFDGDEAWDDVDLFLPDSALPLVRNEDGAGGIRELLFRALRDGSVLESDLIKACLKPDGTRNEEAESLLTFVIGDLGALMKGGAPHDHPQVIGKPSVEEELEVSEAFAFAEDLASGWNDPLRFYLKEFKGELLDAQTELALSREMEESGADALDALSCWPEGLSFVFDAADKVARGEADVEVFSSGAEPGENGDLSASAGFLEEPLEMELDRDAAAFVSTVFHARSLCSEDPIQTRAALASANLSRGFMLNLAAKAGDGGELFAAAVRRQAAARERMICSNLRLAYSVAMKYQWSTEALSDLVQEANIGLMKAVERFDWRRGFRFSTYAMWWIRQQIARAIVDKARVVRVPVHLHETVRKIQRERQSFELRTGRRETEREISIRTGIPLAKLGHYLGLLDEISSLDELDLETGLARVDLLMDSAASDPADTADAEALRKTIIKMVCELDERSAKVIFLRFGLGAEDAMTLEEIGHRFDVTRERIRQLEVKAMDKLSYVTRKMILAPFMGDVDIHITVSGATSSASGDSGQSAE
ncbi:sigma-70 family RNA polymerase sigma factor [Pseudomonas putida]|uniref:sigma-70 family RNA polymerase sigma factor n=1 Tax=Pseudomonas putida TaxID=303 RepID=UPI0029DE6569|nr:sigma-70 family RNA polymerase sigma factor [Pseudomonas putida]WPK00099.1 sigma-70 family RNA polymerase sigma factor [Pseudomonas putida]